MRLFILLCSFAVSSAFADTVAEAYKREAEFLRKQRDSLVKLKGQLQNAHLDRVRQAEAELARLGAELSKLNVANLADAETNQRLEKLVKDAASGGVQLEKNLHRMQEQFRALREKAPFTKRAALKDQSGVEAFRFQLEEGISILKELGQPRVVEHAFLDEDGKLVQGKILLLGLFGAFGQNSGETFHLAPYNGQWLKAQEKIAAGQLLLFDPAFQPGPLKTHAGWRERVADSVPAIVMLIIMLAVVALFVALARA